MRFTVQSPWCALALVVPIAACTLPRAGTRETPAGGAGAGSTGGGAAAGGEAGQPHTGGWLPAEDCLNGVDDNGNQLVDCEDDTCVGYGCVPSQADALFYLTPIQPEDECTPPAERLEWLSCAGCQCTGQAGSCTVTLYPYDSNACSTALGIETGPQCYQAPDGFYWFRADTAHNHDDACTPALLEAAAIVEAGCAVSQAGRCPEGDVCVPSFIASRTPCVLLAGHVACPASYPFQRWIYEGAPSMCSCECVATEPTCHAAQVVVSHDTNNCSGDTETITIGNGCVGGGWVGSVDIQAILANMDCSGFGTPAAATSARTLCCLP